MDRERSGDIERGGPIQEIVERFGQTSSSLSADSVKQTNYHNVWEQSLAGASPPPPAGPVNCFFMFFLCSLGFFLSHFISVMCYLLVILCVLLS